MFESLKNLGDIKNLMGQAQEMQAKAAEMQEALEHMEVQGSAGGGMVTVTANAKGKVRRVAIEPSLLKPEEAGVVEDLIVAAVSDAQEKAAERAQEEMQKLMGDLQLPPGMQGAFGG